MAAATAIMSILKELSPDAPELDAMFIELREEAERGEVAKLLAKLKVVREVLAAEANRIEKDVYIKLMTLGRLDGFDEDTHRRGE